MSEKKTKKTDLAIFYSPIFLEHKAPPGHPEKQERLTAIINTLKNVNFLNNPIIEPRPAIIEELMLIHTKEHIQTVKKAAATANYLDPDTYTSKKSFEVALKAAGAAIQATDKLINKDLKKAFCLIRPPGHHALPQQAMGFCLFNNIAIAAAFALKHHQEKVAILDFDAHHGNGTQAVFNDNDKVLYCSWHQWPYYPGTGSLNEVGSDKGKGSTINIGLPAYSKDDIFIETLEEIALPVLKQFNPSLVMVSTGYDSHEDDPLSALSFSEQGYCAFLSRLQDYCKKYNKGLLLVLEGGYNLHALSNSLLKSLEVLSDKTTEKISLRHGKITGLTKEIKKTIRLYWNI